jgi:hypothetical protein
MSGFGDMDLNAPASAEGLYTRFPSCTCLGCSPQSRPKNTVEKTYLARRNFWKRVVLGQTFLKARIFSADVFGKTYFASRHFWEQSLRVQTLLKTPTSGASALLTRPVHRMMLRRMQSLTDVQALLKEHGYSSELLTVTVEDVRQKDEDMQDDSDEDEEEGPLQAMSDAELEQAMRRASSWLLTMLAHQEAVVDRELMMGLMRRVVEKAIRGRTETFS